MITNAGAVFVGPWSPVSLGDYCAGSTHVLPTGRLRLPLLRAERAELPQDDARRQLHPGCASPRLPARWRYLPTPRICPPTAPRSPVVSSHRHACSNAPFVINRGATATPALDELPLRPELVGETPYGAPQLRCRCLPERQRKSLSAERAGDQRDRGGSRRGRPFA